VTPLKRFPSGTLAIAIAVGLFLPTATVSQNLLTNGDFHTDIIGWMPEVPPGVNVDWDSTVGDPAPGSLRFSADQFTGSDVLSECFDAPPGAQFLLRYRVLAQAPSGGMSCFGYVSGYSGASCSGGRLIPVNPALTELGSWLTEEVGAETTVPRPSFRVALHFGHLAGDETATCHFDSIELFESGAEPVVEVPIDSGPGLALFVASVGLAALWVLRRG